jgi:8-oxo-dGTP pyrophosphatase MutT (NUDIX family)
MAAPTARIPHAPRDAATVVVLREGRGGLEALLLQRPAGMRFAGGAWVFPGGCIESDDCPGYLAHSAGRVDAAMLAALRTRALGAPLDESRALAICIGACRETFEESGILLARRRDGSPCDARLLHALQGARERVASDAARFGALLERHRLQLALDALVYWSNWITPPPAPYRYDTRFFLTQLPAGQQVATRLGEAQAVRWLALGPGAFWAELDPPLRTQPTLLTLRELTALYQHHGSLARLLAAARALQPATVMAKIVRRGEALEGLLPWDEEYAATAGEGVPCDAALRQRLGRFPSRVSVAEAS